MLDTVIRGARVPLAELSGGAAVDIGIVGGVIAEIGPALTPGRNEIDAGGLLVVPGFVDTHLHLDKSRTLGRCKLSGATLQEAISETARIKADFTEMDIYARAERTLRECIGHGTTTVRSHIEVDTTVGLSGWHAIRALRDDYSWAVDIQCCVFAQEGLTDSARGDALLVQALREGADVIGGAPYADPDPAGQLSRVFDLAAEFDVDIDLHLDLAEDTENMQLEDVCTRTMRAGWQHRVTVGHVTQMSLLPVQAQRRLSELIAEAGIGFTVMPATDLYLMGRRAAYAKPRGVVDLGGLLDRGVPCSVATNNVLNAFTPYGDGSLLRMANLYANVTHLATEADLTRTLDLITGSAAALIGISPYTVAPGMQADLVCLDCTGTADAVRRIAQPVWGMKQGKPTFDRPRICLGEPTKALSA